MRGHIRERSPGHWAIILDLKVGGTRKRKWHSFKGTKREAQAECARLITTMKTGGYVEPSKVTVEKFLLDRLAQWTAGKRIGNKTAERYQELIDNQIIPHLGSKKLQQLKPIDIEAWHNALTADGLSTTTIGHAHRLLNKCLKQASRFDLVVKNVAAEADKLPSNTKEVQIINQDRLQELLDKLRGSPFYTRAIISLFMGLRRGELLVVKWKNVDLDRKVIKVVEALEETGTHGIAFKKPKSDAGIRDVGMPDIVVAALREHKQSELELRFRLGQGKLSDDDLLFHDIDGKPQSPRRLSCTDWPAFMRSIGMPGITFHSLRHTHASQLISAGIDIVEVSKRLGHSKPGITLNTYAHLFRQKDDRAVAAINDAVAQFKW